MDRSRAGYTLLELSLVATIMVVLVTLAIPMIGPMFAGSRVNAASDMVRARLTEMRVKAMEEGRPYSFKTKGNKFRVEAADGTSAGAVWEGELPGKVVFRSDGASEGEDFQEIARINASGAPDNDVTISFEDPEGGRTVDLRVRSVTGSMTAEDRPAGRAP